MPLGDSLAACQQSRAAGSHPGGGCSRAQRSVAHPGGELGQGWVAGWHHPQKGKTSPTPVCGVSWSETLLALLSARCRGSLTGSFRAAVAEEGSAGRRGAGGSGNRRPAALRGLASAGSSSPAAARCGPSPGSHVFLRLVPTVSSLAGRPPHPRFVSHRSLLYLFFSVEPEPCSLLFTMTMFK